MPEQLLRKMRRPEWLKTPYAKSTASRTQADVTTLLRKYGVKNHEWATGEGPQGRRAVRLRFELKGRVYRFLIESLFADASEEELSRQAERALFHYLKSVLEVVSVFVSAEQALFAFMETPQSATVFEAVQPHLDKLAAPELGKLLLPPPRQSDRG